MGRVHAGIVSAADLRSLDDIGPTKMLAAATKYRTATSRAVGHVDTAQAAQNAFVQAFRMPSISDTIAGLVRPAHAAATAHDSSAQALCTAIQGSIEGYNELVKRRAQLVVMLAVLAATTIPDEVVGYMLTQAAKVRSVVPVPDWTEVPAAAAAEAAVRAQVNAFNEAVDAWDSELAARVDGIDGSGPGLSGLGGGYGINSGNYRGGKVKTDLGLADPRGFGIYAGLEMLGGAGFQQHRDGGFIQGWNAPKANQDFWTNMFDPDRYVYATTETFQHIEESGHHVEFQYFAEEEDGTGGEWENFALWCIQETVTQPTEKPFTQANGRTVYRRLIVLEDPKTGVVKDSFTCEVVVSKNGDIVTAFPIKSDVPSWVSPYTVPTNPYTGGGH